jgi:hypothetical protein
MNNVSKPSFGINQDSSEINQPKGSYRFALNTQIESSSGDVATISNEQANFACTKIPQDYNIIGKVYLTKGENALFLVSKDESKSEIGILDNNDRYKTYVNADLGFRLNHQIDAIYRLRRGCGRTLYWVDGDNNPPMTYNLDSPQDFKNSGGEWDISKFKLSKTYEDRPTIENYEVLSSGSLPTGSYNISIQYLDEDFNPTEWISTSDTINIYSGNTTNVPFSSIRASSSSDNEYRKSEQTNKSIRVKLSNLDSSFPYYRLAIIVANNGSGEISGVFFTEEISKEINLYTFSNISSLVPGTVEEIQQFSNNIETAKHIDQLENRLILSGVTGKKINWCNLQKYASKISSDLVLEEVILNSVDSPNNQKRQTLHTEKVGYMPGEIYSFGIVYVFEDGYTSPVFHIPGKADRHNSKMSNDNQLKNRFYTDNRSCSGDLSYWGYDTQGKSLVGQNIRHHRFPLRSEIGEELVRKDSNTTEININSLLLDITGELDSNYEKETVDYIVSYTINGNTFSREGEIVVSDFILSNNVLDIQIEKNSGDIQLVSIEENKDGVLVDPSQNSGLTYTIRQEQEESNLENSVYKSNIYGIKFSNVEYPSLSDTGGQKIVGYYIVRNKRDEDNKTILDSGVLTPLLNEGENKNDFISHGHLMPESDNIVKESFALIHPEHKFLSKEYASISEIIKEGEFIRTEKKKSSRIVQDVQPGTSYDAENNKNREKDSDGFSLNVLVRNNILEYVTSSELLANSGEIDEIFYLNTLYSKDVKNLQDERVEIFNVSSDNKIGIVHFNKELENLDKDKLDYVILKRSLSDPYSNYEVLPYYREHTNMISFNSSQESSVIIFNGDSYISPIKYTSSLFYDTRLRKRRTKSGLFNFIVAGLSIAGGVVAGILGSPQGAIAAISYGLAQASTGLERTRLSKVYNDLYDAGLKETIDDEDTLDHFIENPSDDEVRHVFDILDTLWLESSVNMNWRLGSNIGITDYLDPLTAYDKEELKSYVVEKLTILDPEADDGRNYQGFTTPEIYDLNEDFLRRNREKIHFYLPSEFDCCSDCLEEFPHRRAYSEQSFQEELTDNYRVFLPNNYSDLSGETGIITNTFTIQNSFYIQTEEALWHSPQNIQERVTGDIVSFIGTGDFFGIPPRKILDDETGNSAGCQHKWSVTQTPYGVVYVSENQGTVYLFDGNTLKPISSSGLYSWFKEELVIKYDSKYYLQTENLYPYRDNPSNLEGTGFISTYDSRNERLILTKKDFLYSSNLDDSKRDYQICTTNGITRIFNDVSKTIEDRKSDGWRYEGIDEDTCQLRFSKEESKKEVIERVEEISNVTDVHVFLDTSGSFGNINDRCLSSISEAVDNWIVQFKRSNPNWEGKLYKYEDSTERWLNFASVIKNETYQGQDTSTKEVLVISFCNEAGTAYHSNNFTSGTLQVSETFLSDYNNFINNVYPEYKKFTGIHYPIVFGEDSGSCNNSGNSGNLPSSREFLKHSIAALYGTGLTQTQINSIIPNKNGGFSDVEWQELVDSLKLLSNYPGALASNFGWTGKWDRFASEEGEVITSEQFNIDIKEILDSILLVEEIEVDVPFVEVEYEESSLFKDEKFDASWTISYNFKTNSWISWHSYMPNIYISSPNKFYSWLNSSDNIYRHNQRGKYQRYYGKIHPHIIEYVSVNEPLQTKVWNDIKIQSKAEKLHKEEDYFFEVLDKTYNEVVLYNSNQSTGIIELTPNLKREENYMMGQLKKPAENSAVITRLREDWSFNDFRDIRVNYESPMFITNLAKIQENYYIDKVVNKKSLDIYKDWTQLQRLRDKYLCVRLIFNNFDDIRLLFYYSIENSNMSAR